MSQSSCLSSQSLVPHISHSLAVSQKREMKHSPEAGAILETPPPPSSFLPSFPSFGLGLGKQNKTDPKRVVHKRKFQMPSDAILSSSHSPCPGGRKQRCRHLVLDQQ